MTATSLDLSQIKTDALSSAATFRNLIGLGSSDAVTFKEATLTSGTVTSSTPVINATQTWNDGATTFTGFKLNVTNTSSATASKLIDLQINGSTQFSVTKAGQVVSHDITLGSNGGVNGTGSRLPLRLGVQDYLWVTSAGARIRSDGAYSFTNGAIDGGTIDLSIYRDAANTLAQRNGTNAQTFRLYNTYTSSTSFERLNIGWITNELVIDAEAGSVGGTLRGIKIGSATASLLGFYGATPVDQPLTVADPAGGVIVDTEARTAIGEIIDRLQELGLIA